MYPQIKLFFNNIEEITSGFFLLITVTLVILNVILRYVFNEGIYWAEEVATICFIWSVFTGASATYKNRMDIGIDALITKTSVRSQEYIRLLVDLTLLMINGYIFYMSIVFTKISYIKPTAVLGISSAVVNSSLIFGFGLISYHSIRFVAKDIAIIRNNQSRCDRLA